MKTTLTFFLSFFLLSLAHAQSFWNEQGKTDTLLLSVFFDVGKYDLRPESVKTLSDLAEKMKYKPDYQVYVQGSTDDQGEENANITLSNNRCIRVQSELIIKGMPVQYFKKIEGLGENYPIAPNLNEQNRQQNRRVDVMVLYHTPQTQLSFLPPAPNISEILAKENNPFKEEEIAKTEVEKRKKREMKAEEDTLDFMQHLRNLSCKYQDFSINNDEENVITTESGIRIHFPEKSFAVFGENERVHIGVEEFTKMGNMVLAGLVTKTTDNVMLETGGMINLHAKSNGGYDAQLRPNKKITVFFPKRGKNKQGMRAFRTSGWGSNWALLEGIAEPKGLILPYYSTTWNVPKNATAEVKNYYTNYCEACEKGIPYQNEVEEKAFSIFGIKLFSYKPWGSNLKERKRAKAFSQAERENRELLLTKNGVSSCPQMKAKLIEKIENSQGYNEWYLNIFPNMRKFYELLKEESQYHTFSGIKLGWTNCDRYTYEDRSLLTQLNIEEKESAKKIIRIALKEDEVSVPAESFVPKNKALYIIGIKREELKTYLAISETISDEKVKSLEWKEVSDKELVETLNKLKS